MSDYTVTGMISTVVPLILVEYQDIHGKWKTDPSSTISIGKDQSLFKATNRSWSEVPPEGWCKYKTTKGSVFEFYFFDGYSEENLCKTTIVTLNEKLYAPKPVYPKNTKTWTVTYYVEDYPSNQIDIVDAAR